MTFEDAVWIGLGIRLPEPEKPVNAYQQLVDAEAAAKVVIASYACDRHASLGITMAVWTAMDSALTETEHKVEEETLRHYYNTYGASALLRVFANALEPQP